MGVTCDQISHFFEHQNFKEDLIKPLEYNKKLKKLENFFFHFYKKKNEFFSLSHNDLLW